MITRTTIIRIIITTIIMIIIIIMIIATILVIVFPQISLTSLPLTELSNPGASGSVFFITEDDEFIIKTVQHKEADFLQKLLPGYYMVGGS